MAEKESRSINTLNEFLEWAGQFNDGQYLFRGVKSETYEMEASACRRLQGADRNNPSKLLKLNKRLIEDARGRGHDEKDGRTLWDLELLAKLQHFGASTCLIDFTRNALIALWFACESGTKEENDANGTVFAVSRDIRLKMVTSDLIQESIDHFFQVDTRTPYELYQWEPKLQNNRIIAQHSVFVFGGAELEVKDECIIVAGSKCSILKSLNDVSGITEFSMYPDFDGFARLHAHDRIYTEPDVGTYLQRGIEAHQRDDLDDAISYYTEVISLLPMNTFTLVSAYYNRGLAYQNKGRIDLAISDYSKAINFKPDYGKAFNNRGVAYYAKGDNVKAIKDFDRAAELRPNNANTYYARGDAYNREHKIDSAVKDYTTAITLNPNLAWPYYRRGEVRLRSGEWSQAKSDLINAREKDIDFIALFRNDYGSVEGFEQKNNVKLPEDIVAMLTPPAG